MNKIKINLDNRIKDKINRLKGVLSTKQFIENCLIIYLDEGYRKKRESNSLP